jgi:hypothetical protein
MAVQARNEYIATTPIESEVRAGVKRHSGFEILSLLALREA